MVARIKTVAFQGLNFPLVEIQVQISKGMPAFNIVGLAQKAVTESRERVRAALSCLGIALPSKRITVNLSPADLPKDGSHYDLPIALAILAAMDLVSASQLEDYLVVGELELDGSVTNVNGVIAVALLANRRKLAGIICPACNGREAAWIKTIDILAPSNLLQLLNHFQGKQALAPPQQKVLAEQSTSKDFAEVYGQESAKRALEIAAAGKHNLLFIGPPGIGKSMLARRFPTILPPLSAREALEVSVIKSLAGQGRKGELSFLPPFRSPHHTASAAAMIGGGKKAYPGEISLSHRGVLFLDELAEFNRAVLDSLRQPLETGEVAIARANLHITYPAQFQLIAAMNPCRCGGEIDRNFKCRRGPKCALDYQSRISGPLLDRVDIRLDLPSILPSELAKFAPGSNSSLIQDRVTRAREIQRLRAEKLALNSKEWQNAYLKSKDLDLVLHLNDEASNFIRRAADQMRLSIRGYNQTLKLARTIADLEQAEKVSKDHLAEALAYRGGDLPAES